MIKKKRGNHIEIYRFFLNHEESLLKNKNNSLPDNKLTNEFIEEYFNIKLIIIFFKDKTKDDSTLNITHMDYFYSTTNNNFADQSIFNSTVNYGSNNDYSQMCCLC